MYIRFKLSDKSNKVQVTQCMCLETTYYCLLLEGHHNGTTITRIVSIINQVKFSELIIVKSYPIKFEPI